MVEDVIYISGYWLIELTIQRHVLTSIYLYQGICKKEGLSLSRGKGNMNCRYLTMEEKAG